MGPCFLASSKGSIKLSFLQGTSHLFQDVPEGFLSLGSRFLPATKQKAVGGFLWSRTWRYVTFGSSTTKGSGCLGPRPCSTCTSALSRRKVGACLQQERAATPSVSGLTKYLLTVEHRLLNVYILCSVHGEQHTFG